MFDYVKVYFPINSNYKNNLEQNPNLDITCSVNPKTGNVFYEQAKYKNFTITIYNRSIEIKGSLHKLRKLENHSFFNYRELNEAINELSEVLNYPAQKMQLKNVEFANNVLCPFNVGSLVDNFLMHQKKVITIYRNTNFKYKDVEHSQYCVKFYDKGLFINKPIFRFEVKYRKANQFNRFGAFNLSDLRDISVIEKFKIDLATKWQQCLIYEPIKDNIVSRFDDFKRLQWSTITYWENLNHHTRGRNAFSREVKRYNQYQKAETDNKKEFISNKFEELWCEFLNGAK